MALFVLVMFSEIYRRVAYFGWWADDTADTFGRRDALAILRDAVERCGEQDMRTSDVSAALAYLEAIGTRQRAFIDFRAGLDLPDALERSQAVLRAYKAVVRVLSP